MYKNWSFRESFLRYYYKVFTLDGNNILFLFSGAISFVVFF